MTLVIGGLQGSGRSTFRKRAHEYGVRTADTYEIYMTGRLAHKVGYSRITGPHVNNNTESLINEYKDHMTFFVDEMVKDTEYEIYAVDPYFLDFLCDHRPENYHLYLVTADNDDAAQRIFNLESVNDPRLVGKNNAYQLVKPEIMKELTSYDSLISSLESKVDTHIVNNGTLEQYHETIDNILNEHNLLN